MVFGILSHRVGVSTLGRLPMRPTQVVEMMLLEMADICPPRDCRAIHRGRTSGRRSRASRFWPTTTARLLILVSLLIPLAPARATEVQPDLDARVENLLASMTVEERVGQLFLVTFVGNEIGPGSDIAQLVRQDRVGGVVLLASNANLYNAPDTPKQVAGLANGLQSLAMADGARVPLFVAVDHEGDGYPYTRIRGGTTPLPNAMAIGATWDARNAREVGRITGLELAAMGINLLLGPSVDVLSTPRPGGQGDIGTRAFGGDPWWVGEMGRAYVAGVHEGGGGRVATVAKHFPGHGGSDRLPDEEVATVDKSIDELKGITTDLVKSQVLSAANDQQHTRDLESLSMRIERLESK